ncbi:hypothetical protein Tco_0290586 [Tanacetum coccineum]
MGDENPIRILRTNQPSHVGLQDTIELPVGTTGTSSIQHHPVGAKRMLIPRTSCEIDRAAGGKLRNNNADESWEIIENLVLYDHEGQNDTKGFVKPFKAISTPQGTSNTPDRRLLELEDQIDFLLKGSRPAPTPSSTHTPQAYVEQREEINGRMTEMFRLPKELTTSRAPKKVLIREEAKTPVTKSVNSISLIREEEEKNDIYDVATGNDSKETDRPDMEVSVKKAEIKNRAENGAKNKPIKKPEKEEVVEAPSSWSVEYYLKD